MAQNLPLARRSTSNPCDHFYRKTSRRPRVLLSRPASGCSLPELPQQTLTRRPRLLRTKFRIEMCVSFYFWKPFNLFGVPAPALTSYSVNYVAKFSEICGKAASLLPFQLNV